MRSKEEEMGSSPFPFSEAETCPKYALFWVYSSTFGPRVYHYLFYSIWQPSLGEKCPYSELFWFAFSAFGVNTERYRVPLRIQSEYEKMQTRITPNTNTFNAVLDFLNVHCGAFIFNVY